MKLAAGTVVERYTVEDALGAGGMAVVYRVRHNQLGSHHAMKVLSLPAASVRDRLLQEGRLQSALRHPNVVAVTDLVEVDGLPALIMEYVRGPSLSELLQGMRPTFAQVDELAQGIIAGVEAAHRHGLVHRDLKPGNILVSTDSGVPVPKIADFGLAKLLAPGSPGPLDGRFPAPRHATLHTRSGVAMGTPSYMAPEQIRDASRVDARADLFSLGAILYELVTGRRAFDGADTMEIFQAVCAGRPPAAEELAPKAPRRVFDAIAAALAVDPAARVPDCAALAQLWTGRKGPWQSDTAWDQQALFKVVSLSSAGSPAPQASSSDGTFLLHTRSGALTPNEVEGVVFEALTLEPGTFAVSRGGPEVRLTRPFALGVATVEPTLWEAVTGRAWPADGPCWDEAIGFCCDLAAKLALPPAYELGPLEPRQRWTADDAGRALYELLPFERIPAVLRRFGDQTLAVLMEEPTLLLEIEGIGPRTVERITEGFHAHRWFTRSVRATGAAGWRLPTEVEWVCGVRAMGQDPPTFEWTQDADPAPPWATAPAPLPAVVPDDHAPMIGPKRVVRRVAARASRVPWQREGFAFRVARALAATPR